MKTAKWEFEYLNRKAKYRGFNFPPILLGVIFDMPIPRFIHWGKFELGHPTTSGYFASCRTFNIDKYCLFWGKNEFLPREDIEVKPKDVND